MGNKRQFHRYLTCFAAAVVFSSISRLSLAEQTLHLADAVDEALSHNSMLKASAAEKRAAEAKIQPSGALEDPTLTVRAVNYPVTSFSPRMSGMTGNEVAFSQKFPFPGKRTAMESSARHQFESKNEDEQQARLELIKMVKDAYFDLSLSYKERAILDDQIRVTEALRRIAGNRFLVGGSPQTDVIAMEVKKTALLLQKADEDSAIASKKAELDHLLGRTVHVHDWKPEAITPTKVDRAALDHIVNLTQLEAQNPRLRSLHSLEQASESNKRLADLNGSPDFEIGVGYMQRFPNRDDTGDDMVTAQVSMTLPFFERSRHAEEKRQAAADKEKAQALYEDKIAELQHNIHETVASLDEAEHKLLLYQKALLPQTSAAIDAATKSYESGSAAYASVFELMNQRFDAQSGFYKTVAEHEKALARLELLLGTELPLKGNP